VTIWLLKAELEFFEGEGLHLVAQSFHLAVFGDLFKVDADDF
jgi:hypothetical protein